MVKLKFFYYEENSMMIGWLEEYPEYRTQGRTRDELKEHLRDRYEDLSTGIIPSARCYGELAVG